VTAHILMLVTRAQSVAPNPYCDQEKYSFFAQDMVPFANTLCGQKLKERSLLAQFSRILGIRTDIDTRTQEQGHRPLRQQGDTTSHL
jgi:hypothetical protein